MWSRDSSTLVTRGALAGPSVHAIAVFPAVSSHRQSALVSPANVGQQGKDLQKRWWLVVIQEELIWDCTDLFAGVAVFFLVLYSMLEIFVFRLPLLSLLSALLLLLVP